MPIAITPIIANMSIIDEKRFSPEIIEIPTETPVVMMIKIPTPIKKSFSPSIFPYKY